MNASHILDALGTIDDKYIIEAKERSFNIKILIIPKNP